MPTHITDDDFEELRILFREYSEVGRLRERNIADPVLNNLTEQLLANIKGKVYRKIYEVNNKGDV